MSERQILSESFTSKASSLSAGVDVVYSGSQKVLSAPPSTAPISFSPRARDKMATRKKKVQSFYFDMEWLAEYWGVDNSPRVYVSCVYRPCGML